MITMALRDTIKKLNALKEQNIRLSVPRRTVLGIPFRNAFDSFPACFIHLVLHDDSDRAVDGVLVLYILLVFGCLEILRIFCDCTDYCSCNRRFSRHVFWQNYGTVAF